MYCTGNTICTSAHVLAMNKVSVIRIGVKHIHQQLGRYREAGGRECSLIQELIVHVVYS